MDGAGASGPGEVGEFGRRAGHRAVRSRTVDDAALVPAGLWRLSPYTPHWPPVTPTPYMPACPPCRATVPRIVAASLSRKFIVAGSAMATLLFQCPECGFGHHEVGHLAEETEIHCIVCQEEHGRLIRVHHWEAEPDQARLREGLVAA